MSATFTFNVDPDRDLVRIRMSGLFLEEDVAAFVARRREAQARLRCGPNRHLTLNDVREMKIQPQLTVAAFSAILSDPAHRSRRLAFVVSPTLARGQLMRALAGRGGETRCFTILDEAEAWLFSEASAPAEAKKWGGTAAAAPARQGARLAHGLHQSSISMGTLGRGAPRGADAQGRRNDSASA